VGGQASGRAGVLSIIEACSEGMLKTIVKCTRNEGLYNVIDAIPISTTYFSTQAGKGAPDYLRNNFLLSCQMLATIPLDACHL
jgi:hypothetical protein